MTTHATPDPRDGLLLPGLDGTNPLGFLAALGVLYLGTTPNFPMPMHWERAGATWRPRLTNGPTGIKSLVQHLRTRFANIGLGLWNLDNRLPFQADRLREEMINAISEASPKARYHTDMLSALGVPSVMDDTGCFRDTALRMVRSGDSAGNGLLAYARRILEETTDDNLESALADSWKHEDENCALRWDPAEHHGYAHQWTNPSKERTVSVRGGNWLALAAMSLLTTISECCEVGTIAFGRPDGKRQCLTWPIWTRPVSLNVVRSLLTLSALHQANPKTTDLERLGIGAIYRCDRIMTSTYYRNFTPAQRIA
ncbi:MAG: hypothetical protein WD042_14120 [Phycisphaeraceae bacterium]